MEIVYSYLHGMEALSNLREHQLRIMCETVRYERHEANEVLYYPDDVGSCWYILLSGSVFIKESMFLPRSRTICLSRSKVSGPCSLWTNRGGIFWKKGSYLICWGCHSGSSLESWGFGKRSAGSLRRGCECIVLEPSEMIVVDYMDENEEYFQRQASHRQSRRRFRKINQKGERQTIIDTVDPYPTGKPPIARGYHTATENEQGDMDLSGLPETAVDSEEDDDEEDIERASDPLMSRDIVRDCLEKDPMDRTDDDIAITGVHASAASVRQHDDVSEEGAVRVMVFAVVERAGTIVLNDGEELDSWSVILNGSVEVTYPEGRTEILCMGNSFGVSPTMEKEYMKGVMKTKVDDCQFVCIAQQDYCCILNQVEKNMQKVEEEGEIVMVKEHRELDRTGTRKGHIVIKGTSERLTMHLVEEHSVVDPTYIEDFLLTYRTFLSSPMVVGRKLLEWFHDPSLRDKVTRVVLLWVNNHFNDFEGDLAMTQFLEEFENNLEKEVSIKNLHMNYSINVLQICQLLHFPYICVLFVFQKMCGHLRLLNIACAAKAKPRLVTLTKPSRDSPLAFTLLGGQEKGFRVFIDAVEPGSKAAEVGLKRGDQILEVNGQNFENVQLNKANEILKNNTHLSITVKTNLLVFKDLLTRPEHDHDLDGEEEHERKNGAPHLPKIGDIKKASRYSIPDLAVDVEQVMGLEKVSKKAKSNSVGGRNKLKKIFDKTLTSILPPKPYNEVCVGQSQDDSIVGMKQSKQIALPALPVSGNLSSSNPDLLQSHHRILDFNNQPDMSDQVLRVFKADQQSRYIMIGKDTTAKEVVAQAIREFALTAAPEAYSLCEVSVTPEGSNMETETLCSDDDAQDLLREGQISLLQLSTVEVSTQLSMRAFELFCAIEPTEYIDDLYKLRSKTGSFSLKRFEEAINHETFWVATEVTREPNQLKRMKNVKHFIKIALHCRECKNFNSMFAIIRLRGTWEKLPSKYEKLFSDLQDLFDPSRNMAKYRNVLNNQNLQPPIIPLFPVIKKDLTFLHEGNDSKVDGLVNFEKLRMIAKEIRHVGRMASVNMDPALMFRTRSLSQGSANAAVLDVTQTGGHKKRVRRSSFLNAKKLYEDAQMARKVKQYLSNLSLETNEESLQTLSMHAQERRWETTRYFPGGVPSGQPTEGPAGQGGPGPAGPRRGPLPIPEESASTSSPQSLKKILSLSEEGNERHRRQPEDTVSNASSQLSSPPTSPQSSPKKVRSPLAPASSVTPPSTWRRTRGGSVTLESGNPTSWDSGWNEGRQPTPTSTASGLSGHLLRLPHGALLPQLRGADPGSGRSSLPGRCRQRARLLDVLLLGFPHNIQTMQQGRSWETLAFGGGGGGGLPPGGPEALLGGHAALWAAQARGSWASASSSSSSAAYWGEDSEGDTAPSRGGGGRTITSTGSEEAKHLGRPSPSPITTGGKGLLTRKESRYREPPPTPPGYTALNISDLADGQHPPPAVPASTAPHTGRRPPDYSTALQRSRMVTQSPDSHQAQQGASSGRGASTATLTGRGARGSEEEEGESLSSKLVALRKPKPQRTRETPRL
ncbi:hypothetical protein F7725_010524 [Dissostichus mawsoni]|uniref:Rap guanine nucleotide exchange factor 2 n=1 Tax=Dissostichus mawsoni TaxID=36200 RepID=A0A7J5XNP1_DISMA|nr:hypothetical protein F7725_010524 [Dissostichus mawsoni]